MNRTLPIQTVKIVVAIGLAAVATAAVLVWTGVYRADPPVANAASRSGSRGEAEYNALPSWDTGTKMLLPFVNSDPAWGWRTETVVQNTYTDTVTVTLRYFDTAGTETTVSDRLPPLGSRVYTPTGTFSGSLMITSEQNIAVIANQVPLDDNWPGDRLMSYRAVDENNGSTAIALIPIYRAYQDWNTTFAVQNVEETTTAITITFYDMTGTAVLSQTDDLPPHSAHPYDAATIAGLGTDFYGWAYVETDGSDNVVGMLNAVNSQTGEAVAHNNRRIGSTTSSPEVYLPLVMKDHTSSILLYNTDSTDSTTNTITLHDQDGLTVTTYGPFTLAPHAARSISLADAGWSPPISGTFRGAAKVHNPSKPPGVLVNTSWPITPSTFTGYSGILFGGNKTYVPFVRDSAGGMVTQINVQNIWWSGEDSDVAVTYYDEDGTQVWRETATIPWNAAHTFDQGAGGPPSGFAGSAVITSTRNVAVVTLISQGPSNRVFLPLVVRGAAGTGSQ